MGGKRSKKCLKLNKTELHVFISPLRHNDNLFYSVINNRHQNKCIALKHAATVKSSMIVKLFLN
jgi:hypothetical protein